LRGTDVCKTTHIKISLLAFPSFNPRGVLGRLL
jgi:hypothetical protein